MKLYLIYHFQSSHNESEEFRPAKYRVLYFFNDDEFLSGASLRERYKDFHQEEGDDLSFQSLDLLKEFASSFASEYEAEEVRLISAQDYNVGQDSVKDRKGLQQVFAKYGEAVSNPQFKKKGGIFGKFFR
jgi:hypothetical protein